MSTYDSVVLQAISGEQIHGRVAAIRDKYTQVFEGKRLAVDQAIGKAEAERSTVPKITEPTVPDTQGLVELGIREIEAQAQASLKAKQILHAFRVRHGRLDLPEPISVPITVMRHFLGVFMDGGINATFFLTASLSPDPLSALLLSTMIAGVNVSMSACAGFYAGRWIQWGRLAPDPDEVAFRRVRRNAWLGIAVYVCACGFFHLSVGLIRAQASLTGLEYSVSASIAVFTTPESLFLICIGVCLSIYTFQTACTGFGSYPHYANHLKRVLDAEDDLMRTFDTHKDLLDATYAAAIDDHKAEIRAAQRNAKRCNVAVNACARANRAWRASISDAEREMQTEVMTLMGFYLAAQGKAAVTIDRDQLRDLCTLPVPPVQEIPAFVHLPDTRQFENQCAMARDRTVNQLAAAIADRGEPS